MPRPCEGQPDCLPGQVCEFPVGDCAMANGTCAEASECDPSGPVCGCNSNSFTDSCAALAAGVLVASLGSCPNPDSCTNGCGPNQFCRLPDGACARFGFLTYATVNVLEPMLDTIGVCTTIPTDCPPDFDPVCSCDYFAFLNSCTALQAQVSIAHTGVCGEICEGFFGIQCTAATDTCVLAEGFCGFDYYGYCQEDPVTCDNTCAPICDCSGGWHLNQCEAIRADVGMWIRQPGACGETFALQFTSKVDMFWGWFAPGGGPDIYNVYRAPISGTGVPGPWDCVGPALLQPPYAVSGNPAPGEVWGFGVTKVVGGVEGPLGYGGNSCLPRTISMICPP